VVHATGVKVYGEGEWKPQQHGISKRRTWRKSWKRDSGHHRRSIAETTLFRFKTVFGGNLSARQFDNQPVELFIKCAALNRMIQIAKPDSYKVEA